MIKFSKTLDLLIKFAKLTDEQYKSILRDSNKLQLLESKSLLDQFYKARPDKTEKELSEEQSFRHALKEENKLSINNPKVSAFIKSFGSETVPIDIIFRVVKSTIKTESLEEDGMKDLVENLRSHTIKDIIEMFYKNVKYSDDSLLTFINDYENLDILEEKRRLVEKGMELLSDTDKKNLDYLRNKVANDLFIMLDQINKISPLDINLPIEDVMYNKLEESLNLRNSDIFDFVYNLSEELKAS